MIDSSVAREEFLFEKEKKKTTDGHGKDEKKRKKRKKNEGKTRAMTSRSAAFASFFVVPLFLSFFSPQFVRLSFAEFFRFLLGVYCLLGLTRFY